MNHKIVHKTCNATVATISKDFSTITYLRGGKSKTSDAKPGGKFPVYYCDDCDEYIFAPWKLDIIDDGLGGAGFELQ